MPRTLKSVHLTADSHRSVYVSPIQHGGTVALTLEFTDAETGRQYRVAFSDEDAARIASTAMRAYQIGSPLDTPEAYQHIRESRASFDAQQARYNR